LNVHRKQDEVAEQRTEQEGRGDVRGMERVGKARKGTKDVRDMGKRGTEKEGILSALSS
jgi:hypothetical protein